MAYNSMTQLTKQLSRQLVRFHSPIKARETCFLADREGGREEEGGREAGRQVRHHMTCLLAGRLAYAHLALTVQDHSPTGWCCL